MTSIGRDDKNPSMQLGGKVAVITGASMGIGEAVGSLFVRQGASVVLSSRDAARVEAARERIGFRERTLAVTCDVRNREEIDRLMSLTLHNFGRCDIWINNAGHGLVDTVERLDLKQCRALFDTNFFGAVDGMQVAIPVMKRQGAGTIINISSVVGHLPIPGQAAYSASKHAMNAIGMAARMELEGTGVHVMTVCPGYIESNFDVNAVRGADPRRIWSRYRRAAPASVVANAVLDGYLKGKREVVTPWKYHLFIKLYELFPQVLERYMVRTLRPVDERAAEPAVAPRRP